MDDFLMFLMLGLAGSAGPAHIGFRLLAHRHHRDRGWPFSEGSEDGQWGYSAWLMKRGYAASAANGDRDMRFFGFWAMLSGWIAAVALLASGVLIVARQ